MTVHEQADPMQCREDVARDARRYRRLQILGCAPGTSKNLENGTVLCFTNLDSFVDDDLKWHPSRGEAHPLPKPAGQPVDTLQLAKDIHRHWYQTHNMACLSHDACVEAAQIIDAALSSAPASPHEVHTVTK